MGCVVLVVVLPFFFDVAVTAVVDVIVASVGSFAAAAVLVLAVVVVLSILVVVFVFITIVARVVNADIGVGTIEDLLNCVTGSTKETQSRYEKVNLNKV